MNQENEPATNTTHATAGGSIRCLDGEDCLSYVCEHSPRDAAGNAVGGRAENALPSGERTPRASTDAHAVPVDTAFENIMLPSLRLKLESSAYLLPCLTLCSDRKKNLFLDRCAAIRLIEEQGAGREAEVAAIFDELSRHVFTNCTLCRRPVCTIHDLCGEECSEEHLVGHPIVEFSLPADSIFTYQVIKSDSGALLSSKCIKTHQIQRKIRFCCSACARGFLPSATDSGAAAPAATRLISIEWLRERIEKFLFVVFQHFVARYDSHARFYDPDTDARMGTLAEVFDFGVLDHDAPKTIEESAVGGKETFFLRKGIYEALAEKRECAHAPSGDKEERHVRIGPSTLDNRLFVLEVRESVVLKQNIDKDACYLNNIHTSLRIVPSVFCCRSHKDAVVGSTKTSEHNRFGGKLSNLLDHLDIYVTHPLFYNHVIAEGNKQHECAACAAGPRDTPCSHRLQPHIVCPLEDAALQRVW